MNEDENMVCDGCGDERPAAPATKAAEPSFDFEAKDAEVETETDDLQIDSDSPPDDKLEADDSDEKDDLTAQPEPPAKLDTENEDYESPTIVSTPPIVSAPPVVSAPLVRAPANIEEDEETPSLSFTSERLYMVFVNTPAQSLVKSRVAIEFDVFPVISIGRNPENVIVVPDQEVSRKHAQMSLEGGKVILKDLQSANGTFVYDGKQFQRVSGSVEVKPNTILKFGSGTIVRLVNE
jgi:predicted component of type VI protein secretion system